MLWSSISLMQNPSSKGFEQMCETFNNMSISNTCTYIFSKVLAALKPHLKLLDFLLQFLSEEIVTVTLNHIKIICGTVFTPTTDLQPTLTLRYSGGYIAGKLCKKLMKSENGEHRAAADIIKDVSDLDQEQAESADSQSFLAYTRYWVQVRDRGGLHKINDKMYQVFFAMESAVKPILCVGNISKIHNDNISKDSIKTSLLIDLNLISSWDRAMPDLDNEHLKKTFSLHWLTIFSKCGSQHLSMSTCLYTKKEILTKCTRLRRL